MGRPEARRRADIDDDDLGRECEAYLCGDYVRWLEEEGLPVPAWAQLNRVAHATFRELRRHVEQIELPSGPCCFPHAAALIEAVIVATTAPEALRSVQHDVLVPLELELVRHPMSPRAALERVARQLL